MSDVAAGCARAVQLAALPAAICLSLIGQVSASTALCAAVALVLVAYGVAIALADADINLLMRGKCPKHAFHGKVCVVVGGSRGLGESLALYLARSGASLVLCARGIEQLQVLL